MNSDMRLFKRKNGWWYVEFARNDRHSLKTRDYTRARELYGEMERQLYEGKLAELTRGKRISLADFKAEFMQLHCATVADDTSSAYDLALRLLIDSIGASTLVSHIGRHHISKFIADAITRGCKPVTVNTYLRHIRAALNKAHEWGYLKQKIRIRFLQTGKRLPRILAADEIEIILLHASHCQPEFCRVFQFAMWTGARRREIYNLRYEHIRNDTARLMGKGNRERIVPLLTGALEAIGELRDIGPVFIQSHIDAYSKVFKRIARDCGIEDASFHKMRHTAATYMLASGINIKVVKEILGHTDIKTTEIYAQVLTDHLATEIQKFKLI